ncbi:MAG: hypothetical protein ASARMPRED_006266 [Alectoria sarmentosa]|nr:MAG: hypothetical protein ASARMPRED_006266 [Alectoria sarmentosa]
MTLWDKAVESLKHKDKQNVDFQRLDKRAILADILEETQKEKQACIERRLKYKRKNGELVEVGDIAVQYDPGQAALPWAAIRFFLQISVNDVQILGSLAEGLEVVCKIVARFTQRLARSMTQTPDNLIKNHLDKVAISNGHVVELTKILDAERLQLTLARQSSMATAINSLGNGVGALQIGSRESASKLEALLASFQGPLIRTVEQISNLSDNLVHSKTNQMKEERLEVLQWLSSVQYRKHHQSLSKGLLEGTGSWLLAKPQFVDWSNSSVSSVLWLHGIPGSGKTCLISFTSHSQAALVLQSAMAGRIIYCKEYRERKIEADADGAEISRLDISETTEQIIEIASEMPVTIIIDALDECCSGQRHELLGALDVLLERSAHLVKVFVSSRDDVDIVLRLQKHPNIYININDNWDDIRRFIQFGIKKAHNNRRLLKGLASPELITLVAKDLTNRAGGMFLWVNMQIESLCDSRRVKLQGDLVDALARLPRSLTGMYTLILENIGQIDQRGRTVAETIFRWLLCTKDATSSVIIAACSRAISIESRNLSIPDILDVCSTLVVYDESLDRFRFAHLSVREFFESQPGYTPSQANRRKTNIHGKTRETDKEAIVRLLLQKGAFITSADTYGGATFLAHTFKARYGKIAKLLLENGAEISMGATDGPMEQLWIIFDQGQEGLRQTLLERIRGAQDDSLNLQASSPVFSWSGDPIDIAARLIWAGTMRVLGTWS